MTRPGMAVRLLAGAGIGATLALVVLLGVLVPDVVRAQMLICASHALKREDAASLKVAARALLSQSARVLITDACVNPGYALGFLETPKILTADGVQQWWTLNCRREAKPWACDAPGFKQFIAARIDIRGEFHRVELSFDEGFSLDDVRALASRAIEIYTDPASRLPACGTEAPQASDQLSTWERHGSLPTGDKVIHVSVSSKAKGSVDLDDVDVRIDFRSGANAAGSEAVCWWRLIVVT